VPTDAWRTAAAGETASSGVCAGQRHGPREGATGCKTVGSVTAELARADAGRALFAVLLSLRVRHPAIRAREDRDHAVIQRPIAGKADAPRAGGQFPVVHEGFRLDAFPAEADPDTWCFGCYNMCGLELTGAMLKVSPVVHLIRTTERTRAGRPRKTELRYGGAPGKSTVPAQCRGSAT
jgi:hypothetical protein